MSYKNHKSMDASWFKLQAFPVLSVYSISHLHVDAWLQTGTYVVAFVSAIFFLFKGIEDYRRSNVQRVIVQHELQEINEQEEEQE